MKLELTITPGSVLAAALLVVLSLSGLALAAVAGTASRWNGNNLELQGSSGANAFAFQTNGLRADFGTGANDYIDSDGTNLAAHTKLGVTSNSTTCTLNGASPATCTATVTAGASCHGTVQGTTAAAATAGVAVSLASTTLTVTAGNGHTEIVNIFCDK